MTLSGIVVKIFTFVSQLCVMLQGDEPGGEHYSVDSASTQAAASCDEEFSSADKKLVPVTVSLVAECQLSCLILARFCLLLSVFVWAPVPMLCGHLLWRFATR